MERKQYTWTIESPRALGVALRSLRERKGLTQDELAAALRTTRQRISRMENGQVSEQVVALFNELKLLGAVLRLEEADVGS